MYPISWEAFLDPSDSYFLFAEERGYQTEVKQYTPSPFGERGYNNCVLRK
jgi:hypothetical protein